MSVLKKYTGLTGEIAENAGLISGEQRESALKQQAAFWAIAEKEEDSEKGSETDFWNILKQQDSAKATEEAIQAAGVEQSAVDKKYRRLQSGDVREAPRSVPVFGKILEARFLEKAQTQPLLALQGAARTVEAVNTVCMGDFAGGKKENIENTLFTKNPRTGESELARSFIGRFPDDPAYLVAAQATNHLADMFKAAIADDKSLLENETVTKALSALREQGLRQAREAAEEFKRNPAPEMQPAAERIENDINRIRTDYAAHTEEIVSSVRSMRQMRGAVPFPAKVADDEQLKKAVTEGLKTLANKSQYLSGNSFAFKQLTDRRLGQAFYLQREQAIAV